MSLKNINDKAKIQNIYFKNKIQLIFNFHGYNSKV